MKTRMKKGFTLVEILIVVVILGILAAIVIPQFSSASEEASINRVAQDLQTVRSQIQLYKIQHFGRVPDADRFLGHMTGYTLKTTARTADDTTTTASTAGALGPYLQQIPSNPFVVEAEAKNTAGGTGGWNYDPSDGSFDAMQGSCDVTVKNLTLL